MNPIDDAVLAVMASISGDLTDANHHLQLARERSRAAARRDRQIVEIATLIVAGNSERAEALALVHAAEFIQDADFLQRVAHFAHRTSP